MREGVGTYGGKDGGFAPVRGRGGPVASLIGSGEIDRIGGRSASRRPAPGTRQATLGIDAADDVKQLSRCDPEAARPGDR